MFSYLSGQTPNQVTSMIFSVIKLCSYIYTQVWL